MNRNKSGKENHTLLTLAVLLGSMAITVACFGTTSNAEGTAKTAVTQVSQTAALSGEDSYYNEKTEEKLFALSLGDERFRDVLNNYSKYPQYLLDLLCDNPDLIELVLIYGNGYDPSDCYVTMSELEQDIPLFIQWDKRWGFEEYGDDIIALSGCGPTCLSMVAVGLTKNAVYSPKNVAEYSASHGYYQYGTGTSWALFTQGSEDFGIECEELTLDRDVVFRYLEQGNPVICSMAPGDFTNTGHFIVLTGTENGMIKVNDPNSYSNSEKLWEYSDLEWQIRNLWGFYKN